MTIGFPTTIPIAAHGVDLSIGFFVLADRAFRRDILFCQVHSPADGGAVLFTHAMAGLPAFGMLGQMG